MWAYRVDYQDPAYGFTYAIVRATSEDAARKQIASLPWYDGCEIQSVRRATWKEAPGV